MLPLPRPAPILLSSILLPILSILLLAACSRTSPAPAFVASPPDNPQAIAWLADVSAMADAEPEAGRRGVIEQRLGALAIDWQSETFAFNDENGQLIRQGENLLADVAGAADLPVLLLGAHYDRVAAGQGAVDNASGSATVLALAERFKQRPLARHRVAVAFWDLEEHGLVGARAFVSGDGPAPALYVNVDVFGWGDTLWMMAPDAGHPLVAASQRASDEAGLQLSAGAQYPPTDHRAFLEAGWPAVSYSLVDKDEIEHILQAYAGMQPDTLPRVMQLIHTAGDTIAEIDSNAAGRGVDALEQALRGWDAAGGSGTPAAAATAGTP